MQKTVILERFDTFPVSAICCHWFSAQALCMLYKEEYRSNWWNQTDWCQWDKQILAKNYLMNGFSGTQWQHHGNNWDKLCLQMLTPGRWSCGINRLLVFEGCFPLMYCFIGNLLLEIPDPINLTLTHQLCTIEQNRYGNCKLTIVNRINRYPIDK